MQHGRLVSIFGQMRKRDDLPAVFVFVAPPSVEELEKRLRGRGTESDEQVQQRVIHAKQEIARYPPVVQACLSIANGHRGLHCDF